MKHGLLIVALLCGSLARAQVTISREGYGLNGVNVNASESVLTPATVASASFQKLFSWSLDGWPYAQFLEVTGSPDILIAATMNDTVYEFNADSTTATSPIVSSHLVPGGEEAVPTFDVNILSSVTGILSAPVYDASTSTIYVVTFTCQVASCSSTYTYRLHALALSNLAEKFSGPVTLTGATIIGAQNIQRAGLTLANGQIYVAWASWGDNLPYKGYVTAYSASTLALNGTLTIAPSQGGVWQAGKAPVVDGSGSVYFASGNGGTGGCNFGTTFDESVVRLTNASGANEGDYFTTANCATYNTNDTDLGSAGPMLMGNGDLIQFGKDNYLHLLSTANLGQEHAGDTQIVQLFKITTNNVGSPSTAAYFNGTLYSWANGDNLKSWTFGGTLFTTTPALTGSITDVDADENALAPAVVVSANGTSNPVIWTLRQTSISGTQPAALEAYNTTALTQLYSSNTNSARDGVGGWIEFTKPLVDGGKVFVGTSGPSAANPAIEVYGLTAQAPLPAPAPFMFADNFRRVP